ncbi:MAG: glutaredoxin family protein [candidate division Zixibacteria bacterium]|nr:glutaredoxin family protein [candidate division Zixibacteria bacterium]
MTDILKRIDALLGRAVETPGIRRITLYSRPECHLCENVHAVLERVRCDIPFDFEEVDITTDPTLVDRYGLKIPVVLIDGVERFYYRVNERRLRKELGG